MPATGSGFANMCLNHMVDADVDLLILDFVTNDFVVVGGSLVLTSSGYARHVSICIAITSQRLRSCEVAPEAW